jgi:alpha-galactosidase
MNTPTQARGRRLAAALALTAAASPGLLEAASMSASPSAPAVNGIDIANLTTITGTDKWFAENSAAGAAKGQTFTTGAVPVLLKSITYQVTSSQKAEPTKQYAIRVGTISGTTFTQLHSETATQNFTWKGGEYMTWTLTNPVLLNPGTTYAIDVGMTSSSSSWTTGIPYINLTANNYSGGQRYSSGTSGLGNATVALVGTSDRIFHIDFQHPLNPTPDIGTEVPAGDFTLSWTNPSPTTGSDVWVDLWFGTNPGALAKVATAQQNLSSFPVNLPGASTYYWRVDSYLDGAPTGTPLQSTVFSFVVFDSDGDGFPDSYELLHTNPPSATALNRGDDRDQDNLTNWSEYANGTNPSDPDGDNDGLLDGNNVTVVGADPRHAAWAAAGIRFTDQGEDRSFRSELAIGTDPLKPDTDGDGLSDSVETNTGTWAGTANSGTHPLKADTDADGLKDGVETQTGTYLSATQTGTHPLLADTDGDGAGDWYEVAASFTNPTSAAGKPNIPYPLPAPDSGTGATNKPVKVYIMSGQSNMVGFGRTPGTEAGTLTSMVKSENKFPNLVTSAGAWAARQDVRYRGVISAIGNDLLKPQFGADSNSFGPELGFGHVMGWHHDEPVLLIKTSIGNRSLLWDCLPPGSPRFNYGDKTYAGYGDSPNNWITGTGPTPYVWYAGKQYDDYFLAEADMRPGMSWLGGRVFPDGCQIRHNGIHYISKDRADVTEHTATPDSEPGIGANWTTYWSVYSVTNVTDVLDNFATQYPSWAAQGFEIAGYVWFQGNKDLSDPGAGRYQANLVRLIKEVRAYYANRYPGKCGITTPFVLATGCGDPGTSGFGLTVANAQLAVSGEKRNYPEFVGNVKTMDTRGYWRTFGPSPQGYHYYHNAETFLLTGDALGRAMVELQTNAAGYTGWTGTPFSATLSDTNPALDFDRGGLDTGIEWVLGGDPTRGTDDAGLAPVVDTTNGPGGKILFVYRRSAAAAADAQTTIAVEYGGLLPGWTTAVHQGSGADDITITEQSNGFGPDVDKVTVALPGRLATHGKLFVRLKVTVAQP